MTGTSVLGRRKRKAKRGRESEGWHGLRRIPCTVIRGQYWKSSRKRASQKLKDKYESPMVIIYQLPPSSFGQVEVETQGTLRWR